MQKNSFELFESYNVQQSFNFCFYYQQFKEFDLNLFQLMNLLSLISLIRILSVYTLKETAFILSKGNIGKNILTRLAFKKMSYF